MISLAVFIFSALISFAQLSGKVVGITDGDTFTLLLSSNETIRIRIHGIDCPEKVQLIL